MCGELHTPVHKVCDLTTPSQGRAGGEPRATAAKGVFHFECHSMVVQGTLDYRAWIALQDFM